MPTGQRAKAALRSPGASGHKAHHLLCQPYNTVAGCHTSSDYDRLTQAQVHHYTYSQWGSNPRPMAHKTIALTTEL